MRLSMPALAFGLVLGLGLAGPVDAQVRPTPPAGGGGGGGAQPQPQGQPQPAADQFIFKVCNRSKIQLFVAMLYKVQGESWRYLGWAKYDPNTCSPVQGTYPRDSFYWYAENGPGTITYAGSDAQGCVNQNDAFDRTVSGQYSCNPGEKIVGFSKITPDQINNGITLVD